jgi:protein gp37
VADKSAIEWTDATWNPVTGCSKVSPGCAHCYAERNSHRFGFTTKPWTPDNAWENVVLHPERLDLPLHWKKPKKIFVCSMSDLFHKLVPINFIGQVFTVMSRAPQHNFQVLTKRPEAMRYFMVGAAPLWIGDEPLPNVWLGTSIENDHFVGRADALRKTPAAIRFISAEPLLGPLVRRCDNCQGVGYRISPYGFTLEIRQDCRICRGTGWAGLDLTGIDWLIIGGESGPKARPMEPQWVRDLIAYAKVCRTKVLFKQWGGLRPGGDRLVDGVLWDEYPR